MENFGYGSKEAPLDIEVAREKIREDFRVFAGLVMKQVQFPTGYAFRALSDELRWFGGCAIASSNSGVTIYGQRQIADDVDALQIQVSVRYFHPELHYREGRRKPKVSRQYNNGFGAHLWVDQGRPFFGMQQSLIEGQQFCSGFATVEGLAESVVQRVNAALARRKPSDQKTPMSNLAIAGQSSPQTLSYAMHA